MITIILPTYGEPKRLTYAIDSICNQTVSDWELFVVDDNNPETENRKKTEAIMEKYVHDGRIHYLQHDKNKNGSAARNTGILNAKGKYISFLDDDDVYVNTRFEECLKQIELQDANDIAGVYTGCTFFRDGKLYKNKTAAVTGNFLKETLAVRFRIYTGSNLFIKKCVVDELGGFDESFIRHQDYEFLVRLFRKYKLIGISKPLVIKNETLRNLPNITKLENVKKQYLKKYENDINNLKRSDRNFVYYSHWMELAHMAREQNDTRFSEYFKRATEYRMPTLIDAVKLLLKR